MSNYSPDPGTEQTNAKAYVALAIGALSVFLGALLMEWTDTDPLEARDFVVALAAAVGGGIATGLGTYYKSNDRDV